MGLARESLVVGVTLVLGSGSSVAVERLHLRRGEHARPQPHVIDHPHEVLAVVALAALADDQIVRPHHEVAGVVCGGGLYAVQEVVQVGAWPRTRPVRKAFRLNGGCKARTVVYHGNVVPLALSQPHRTTCERAYPTQQTARDRTRSAVRPTWSQDTACDEVMMPPPGAAERITSVRSVQGRAECTHQPSCNDPHGPCEPQSSPDRNLHRHTRRTERWTKAPRG